MHCVPRGGINSRSWGKRSAYAHSGRANWNGQNCTQNKLIEGKNVSSSVVEILGKILKTCRRCCFLACSHSYLYFIISISELVWQLLYNFYRSNNAIVPSRQWLPTCFGWWAWWKSHLSGGRRGKRRFFGRNGVEAENLEEEHQKGHSKIRWETTDEARGWCCQVRVITLVLSATLSNIRTMLGWVGYVGYVST